MVADEDDIYYSFQAYYERGGYKVDMIKDQSSAGFMTWGKEGVGEAGGYESCLLYVR